MDENRIIPYIEPIFRFCCKRISNRYDAEDLASEIIYHVLVGMNKYQIESLEAWVWRIAHNRYARFIDNRTKSSVMLSCEDELYDIPDQADEEDTVESSTRKYFVICTRFHQSIEIFLLTTTSENYRYGNLRRNIRSPKPQSNGASMSVVRKSEIG